MFLNCDWVSKKVDKILKKYLVDTEHLEYIFNIYYYFENTEYKYIQFSRKNVLISNENTVHKNFIIDNYRKIDDGKSNN